ncbi:hypothetical protein [Lentibacillus salinarum]|uniref:Uncharacterized protein n=1 Tax=Lentibacillus salinarum TaxID=446820 RepID=A0ABW3ZQ58_9BACI
MNGTQEEILKQHGIHFHFVPTEKFKTISLTAKFKAPLTRDTITKRALLPYVLQQGTQSYPDRRALQTELDRLYGAVLAIDGSKKGNSHILTVRLEFAIRNSSPMSLPSSMMPSRYSRRLYFSRITSTMRLFHRWLPGKKIH